MISRLFRCATPRQMTSFSWEKQYFSYCFENNSNWKNTRNLNTKQFFWHTLATFFSRFLVVFVARHVDDINNHWKTTTNSFDRTIFSNHCREIYVYDFTSFSLRDARAVFPGREKYFYNGYDNSNDWKTTGKSQ